MSPEKFKFGLVEIKKRNFKFNFFDFDWNMFFLPNFLKSWLMLFRFQEAGKVRWNTLFLFGCAGNNKLDFQVLVIEK